MSGASAYKGRIAFVTGSRAYGKPGPASDIDLVVQLTQAEVEVLRTESEQGSSPPGSTSMKFGKLNLIVPDSPQSLAVWQQGTEDLIGRSLTADVSRAEALAHFWTLRTKAGIV
jgi:hypothetical protein